MNLRELPLLFVLLVSSLAPAASAQRTIDLTTLPPPSVVRIQGEDISMASEAGTSVAGGFDFNLDGLADVLVGAPALGSTGRAYVVFGTTTPVSPIDLGALDGTNGFALIGATGDERLGEQVASAGDLNGDGHDDVVLGAPQTEFAPFGAEGRCHVVFGGPTVGATGSVALDALDGTNGFSIVGVGYEPRLGRSLAPLGDGDGDGIDDLLLGIPRGSEAWPSETIEDSCQDVLVGDLDGDADIDVIVVEWQRHSARIFFNAGDGTFPTFSTLNIPFEPFHGQIGDLDGDNDLDLVFERIDGSLEGLFSVYLNTGNGTFQPPIDYPFVLDASEVILGDFDADGDLDIAVTPYDEHDPTPVSDLLIYENDGSAGFTQVQTLAVGGEPQVMVAIDLDSDMDLDIAAMSEIEVEIDTFINNGSGSFTPGPPISLPGGTPRDLVVGDVNGDGRDDLIGTGGEVLVWLNSAGGLGTPASYPQNATSERASLADMNGDGTLDLVVPDDDDVIVLLNPGNGTFPFSTRVFWEGVGGPTGVADLDGDSFPDLAIADPQEELVSFVMNRGDGTFPGAFSGGAFVLFGDPAIGASGSIDLDSLTGSDGFRILGQEASSQVGEVATALGDMNGDGIDDFAVGIPFKFGVGQVAVVFGASDLGSTGFLDLEDLDGTDGFVVFGEQFDQSFGITLSGDLDFNGDSLTDIAIGARDTDVDGLFDDRGRVYVLYGAAGLGASGSFPLASLDGSNGFRLDGYQVNARFGEALTTVGDVDGDLFDDFLVGSPLAGPSGGLDYGEAHLVRGGPDRAPTGAIRIDDIGTGVRRLIGQDEEDDFGAAVGGGGDWNGDGRPDALVGAPLLDLLPGTLRAGAVYILLETPALQPLERRRPPGGSAEVELPD